MTVSQAWVEDDDGVDYYASTFPVDGSSTNSITIDGQGLKKASNIRTYSTDTSVNTIEANADVLRDSFGSNGGLSWSRWVGGTYRNEPTTAKLPATKPIRTMPRVHLGHPDFLK